MSMEPSPTINNPLIDYWKLVVLGRYAQFDGRARRAEYWWFTLATFILFMIVFVVSAIVKPLFFLSFILWIGLIVPSIAVAIRRLHDTDKSGWFILFGLIPFIGGIILLIFMVTDSTHGTNQYGTSEKYPV
jgi:uncharacterized membrane protein YhaH (DUF805 family)